MTLLAETKHLEVLLVPLMLVAALGFAFHRSRRAAAMLADWARSRGVEILSKEECWLFRGPFFWTTSKSQIVYRLTVRDGDGRARTGYVRLGGWLLGLWSDNVDERWD